MAQPREFLNFMLSYFQQQDVPVDVVDEDVFYRGLDIAVSHAGGIGLISAIGEPEDWSLAITSGVAVDVPDIVGSLDWVNSQNRRIEVGRYYCAINRGEGLAAVVHEETLPGSLLDMAHQGSRSMALTVAFSVLVNAAESSADLITKCGGRPFSKDSAPGLAVIRG